VTNDALRSRYLGKSSWFRVVEVVHAIPNGFKYPANALLDTRC
jgi:hypothetical protein